MINLTPNVEQTSEQKLLSKQRAFAFHLETLFSRIGRDENGNPLYEAPLWAVQDAFNRYRVNYPIEDIFFIHSLYVVRFQSYSLKTDFLDFAQAQIKF